MSFASPIWLFGLIPWLGLVVWLMIGSHQRVSVPFLQLWPKGGAFPAMRRALYRPPLALVLLLLAMLLGLLAAARPVRSSAARPITLVIDRGVSMQPRWDQALQLATDALAQVNPTEIELITIPNGSVIKTTTSQWAQQASDEPFSTIKTKSLLRRAIEDARARHAWPILVVSDQTLDMPDSRIVQISSQASVENITITHVAARDSTKPQLMISLRNDSSLGRAGLRVTANQMTMDHPIDLPARGETRSCFVGFPAGGAMIELEIESDDDFKPDNHAWLVRQRPWPRLEARVQVSQPLAKMIDVYQQVRPGSENSRTVIIAPAGEDVRPGTSAVIIANDVSGSIAQASDIRAAAHPVVEQVDWKLALENASISQSPPGDWTPLLSANERVIVAVREVPARQVWVGFSSESFPRSADYVVFWTNIFDWAGQGDEEFASEPIQPLTGQWRQIRHAPRVANLKPAPGVYLRDESEMRAMNLLDVRFDQPPAIDWQARLKGMNRTVPGVSDFRAAALLAALVLGVISALCWSSDRAGWSNA